jgi:hypothetical protein
MNYKIKSIIKIAVKNFVHQLNTLDLAYFEVIEKCKKRSIKLDLEDLLDIEIEIFNVTKNLLIGEKLNNSKISFFSQEPENVESAVNEIFNEMQKIQIGKQTKSKIYQLT